MINHNRYFAVTGEDGKSHVYDRLTKQYCFATETRSALGAIELATKLNNLYDQFRDSFSQQNPEEGLSNEE